MEVIIDFWNWVTADGVAAFVTAAGLLYTIKSFNKQQKLIVFMDYTKRYQEICLNFPENINEPDFCFDKLEDKVQEKTLRYMRAYFDLCSEEYHLFLQKHIDKATWKEWESGIQFALSKKAFRDAWSKLELDTIYYADFSSFVAKTIKNT
ncbi:TPA: hypothetical protein JG809_004765 [Vibrio parahaemolyticus]|uniref:hypothetical protein n=1 Tax=Vibrio harveyi group TaxID=717610 RepID=UPI00037D78C1|nr:MULTISPECIES: hypothetical protein [Vibrio harveyi group]EJA7342727.1 hypothetical protein [Vibrio parahaemolyticus]EKB1953187.1 hypothetical protein [Vibrio parahaemolyticus]MBY3751573.1 hypothetical protein [Vibrio parahaemolyticus]MBY3762518.1 hypothetical protein [Vibrio parahaemolyticus]MBY3762607.1 hypothetical protein [Vibrio parahaemolyticus]